MNISDKDAIELARSFLEEKCVDAAEPLWDLDDFGNPIYTDPGCATWVCCELFEFEEDTTPVVERDGEETIVVIRAKTKWSHWNYMTIREFRVPILFEDGEWFACADALDWDDVSLEVFEECE